MEARRASHERADGARRHRFDRRASGSRGAALVEFALIVPVLFLVLFGVIEFGIALNDYQSIRQGVREGARQAVVQQEGSSPRQDCTTATAPASVKKVICLTKDRIGLGDEVRVRVRYTAPLGSGGDYGSIEVCAQRNVEPFTGAIPAIDGIHLKSSIEMRLEDDLADETVLYGTSYGDPAPTGGNWTWSGCV